MVGSMALLTVVSLLFTRTVDPRWFILLRLLQGASAAVGAVIFAYVAQVSAPKERSRALGVVMSASTGGGIAGPAVGAALYHSAGGGRGGFHTIFYFIAALAAFAAVVIVSLIREPTAAPSRRAVLDVGKRWSRYRHAVTPAVVGLPDRGLDSQHCVWGISGDLERLAGAIGGFNCRHLTDVGGHERSHVADVCRRYSGRSAQSFRTDVRWLRG